MLLDTCALLWLAQGGCNLSPEACEKIDQSPAVYVSAISGFEIALKQRKGKLKLPTIPEEWFKVVSEHHDLQIIPLDLEICIHSTQLPAIHADPCDRFIIATAKIHNFQVVTSDLLFNQYEVDIIS